MIISNEWVVSTDHSFNRIAQLKIEDFGVSIFLTLRVSHSGTEVYGNGME